MDQRMTDIFVMGVGMTPFGKQFDKSLKMLCAEASSQAFSDAGCTAGDVEAIFFGNCVQGHMEGQDMIRGEIVARAMGISSVPVVNVENACATASTALHMAAAYVRSGAADVVLALGAEKMYSPDKALMFSAFDGAWDVHETESGRAQLLAMGNGVDVPEGTTSSQPYSVFMDVYAAMARAHMKTYGSTQAQIAAVSAKNHMHSTRNLLAQYRLPYTVESVLASDRLPVHTADVLPDQRRRRRCDHLQRSRSAQTVGSPGQGAKNPGVCAANRRRARSL
jgi:acetyl-CoA acetyltransferase